jgi:hypothetical protein
MIMDADQLLGDAVAFGEGLAEGGGFSQRVEGRDPLSPGMGRRQRHLDLGDDAVDAIGVHHLEDFATAQFDQARLRFDGHDFDRNHRAEIVDLAPGAGAGAGRPACDEPAERRLRPRRGMHAQLLAERRQGLVDVEHIGAGFEAARAEHGRNHAVDAGHVEHHAAFQRHGLPVIAGAAAAHGQRDAMACASRGDAADLVLVARQHDQFGVPVFQIWLEHRREPEEVAAMHAQGRRIVIEREIGEISAQRGEGRVGHGSTGHESCSTLTG